MSVENTFTCIGHNRFQPNRFNQLGGYVIVYVQGYLTTDYSLHSTFFVTYYYEYY